MHSAKVYTDSMRGIHTELTQTKLFLKKISKFSSLLILMQLMFECMRYEKFCIDVLVLAGHCTSSWYSAVC